MKPAKNARVALLSKNPLAHARRLRFRVNLDTEPPRVSERVRLNLVSRAGTGSARQTATIIKHGQELQ